MRATISFKNCEKCSPSTFCIIRYLGSYRMMYIFSFRQADKYAMHYEIGPLTTICPSAILHHSTAK